MPRFVILRHVTPPSLGRPSHYDLLLEDGTSLATWALAEEPTVDLSIRAVKLAPHRTAYLDYEGPIARDRGSVQRWDAGYFQWLQREEQLVRIYLSGRQLVGTATLAQRRTQLEDVHDEGDAFQSWEFTLSSA